MKALVVLGAVLVALSSGCSDTATGVLISFAEVESDVPFGTVRGDVTTLQTITIEKPFVPGANVVLESSAGPFSPVPGELPVLAGTGIQFSFRVIFDPTVPSLTQSSTAATGFMRLRFTKQDGSLTLTTLVGLTADVEVPAPLVFQNTLDFGPTAFGESIASSFTVTNPNAATPLNVESAVVGGGAFTLLGLTLPLTVPPGTTFPINVNYTPPGTGTHAAVASLTSNVGGPFATTLLGQGIPSEVVTDFGFVPVDGFGETAWLEFTLSTEAISFHLEVLTSDPFSFPLLYGLEGPGGNVYESDALTGPLSWIPANGLGGLFIQVPNSDDPIVSLVSGGGTYRMRFLELGSNSGMFVKVRVEQRHQGRTSDGLLPVNVFIADGIPVTAADAPTDAGFQTILDTIDALFAQRGLRLSDVSFFDISNPAYDEIDSDAEREAMVASESAVAPEHRLNLFFVQGFPNDPGTLGVSQGIPGLKMNGTRFSGITIVYDGMPADLVGATTAHEAGHYLGLFHTTQHDAFGDPVSPDPILDTLVCPDFPDPVCPILGDNNLMWPYSFPFANGLLLSRGQGNVFKNHSLVEPGTPPPLPPQIAQLAQRHLPIEVPRGWCANCARARRR